MRLADVRLGVAHIGGSEVAVHRVHILEFRLAGRGEIADMREQFVQGSTVTHRHVVYLIHRLGYLGRCRQQIGLDSIGNEAKVSTGFAVAVDVNGFIAEQGAKPLWNDGRVRAIRILPWTEYVEVPQTDCL
ncbi:hypothetical protein D3C87_1623260 [compost metagenome]